MICLCFLSSGFFSRRLILLLVAPFIKTILLFSVAIALLERLNTTKHFTFMQSGQKCFFFVIIPACSFQQIHVKKRKKQQISNWKWVFCADCWAKIVHCNTVSLLWRWIMTNGNSENIFISYCCCCCFLHFCAGWCFCRL